MAKEKVFRYAVVCYKGQDAVYMLAGSKGRSTSFRLYPDARTYCWHIPNSVKAYEVQSYDVILFLAGINDMSTLRGVGTVL